MLPDDDYNWQAFARATRYPAAPVAAPPEPTGRRFGVDGVITADLYDVDPVTGERVLVQHEVSHNTVVNAGLNWLRSLFDGITPVAFVRQAYAAIGTGGTAVSASNTTLGTETAREAIETYAAGGTGELVVPPDTAHRTHIDPRPRAWDAVTSRIDALLEQATAAPDPA